MIIALYNHIKTLTIKFYKITNNNQFNTMTKGMFQMNYEEIIMELIVNSGNARSKAMEAIQAAKAGNILEARELHKKAGAELSKAHQAQTQLIQDEATGNPKTITLLLIHAQDHLMNAMTIRDLAEEFIDMYENLQLQNHKREEKK